MQWKEFDPTELVTLAKQQFPDEIWLHESLSQCLKYAFGEENYVYFIPREAASTQGLEWEFHRNIMLRHPIQGQIVLDILKNGRIGGMEFLDKVLT